jgi:hypothetical protein
LSRNFNQFNGGILSSILTALTGKLKYYILLDMNDYPVIIHYNSTVIPHDDSREAAIEI